MTTTDPLSAILRQDFSAFAEKCFGTLNSGREFQGNWHLDAMAHQLEQCRGGVNTRLIITVPPRHLKSQMASVAFPAFVLGHDPTQRIICLSYSQDLSLKHARDFRNLVNEPWYQRTFGQMRAERDTEAEFITTKNGFRFATSISGTLTGRGADILIVDDPLKPEDAMSRTLREQVNNFFGTTLYSRLDDKKNGVIIVVMQRLHNDDLVGHLLTDPDWRRLNLPAIAVKDEDIALGNGRFHTRRAGDALHPSREPHAVLEGIKRKLGSFAFQSQYQQAPVPEAGNLIKREWLKSFDRPPIQQPGDVIVQSWDTAMKGAEHNDYSVCTTWLVRNENYYLLDLVRQHCDFPTLVRLAVDLRNKHKPDAILLEDHGSGTALIQDLRRSHRIPTISIRPEGDKLTRLSVVSPMFEAGQVFLPRDASWLADFIDELFTFPQVRFDDQVDSVSQFLNWRRLACHVTFNYEFM